MEPENHAGILESGRKVDTKWSNPRGYEGSGSRRKPPTTRQSLARRVVTEVTLESSAPIEERLTWPVRVVLLGGGGHAATSYQMCAWHDALAVPLWKHKVVPPLPDGRTTPTGQGHYQKWGVWRKHEAESMYVANSKLAIWRWGEGRAGVKERVLISGKIELT